MLCIALTVLCAVRCATAPPPPNPKLLHTHPTLQGLDPGMLRLACRRHARCASSCWLCAARWRWLDALLSCSAISAVATGLQRQAATGAGVGAGARSRADATGAQAAKVRE